MNSLGFSRAWREGGRGRERRKKRKRWGREEEAGWNAEGEEERKRERIGSLFEEHIQGLSGKWCWLKTLSMK